ncbi:hypothetical protein H9X85_05870 [Anaerotignum lactatifermentans]|uniref:Uncharacterized protein n=1 Tax=Anaerotignum lactatifermentans TaxID=160404 RepID=A0ABS2G854_9FIRM|nr:hypothetical protein [Anaerotignum lactatifermentans]MBM6829023.1 hypothetical protein [Anaerotignum lactatifermentans]MBM6877370.1 hypothetical protein [Anaerotignum lactatifermentans]MBM6950740.1 hypothetical protein [Anaerotignum lactatifermentans]
MVTPPGGFFCSYDTIYFQWDFLLFPCVFSFLGCRPRKNKGKYAFFLKNTLILCIVFSAAAKIKGQESHDFVEPDSWRREGGKQRASVIANKTQEPGKKEVLFMEIYGTEGCIFMIAWIFIRFMQISVSFSRISSIIRKGKNPCI